jgi:hypothetical protein
MADCIIRVDVRSASTTREREGFGGGWLVFGRGREGRAASWTVERHGKCRRGGTGLFFLGTIRGWEVVKFSKTNSEMGQDGLCMLYVPT